MPRPKSKPDADVLAAAGRVFLRLGPGRATLADVAAEAGLSPATLVQRFGGKRALLVAFAARAAERAAEPFAAARAEHTSPLDALRAAIQRASRDATPRHRLISSMALLLEDLRDRDLRAAAALHARRTEEAIGALLDAAVEEGELAAASAAQTVRLARLIQAAWNGALVQWALRGQGTLARALDEILDAILAPHRRRPAPRPAATPRSRAR
jgi:AcrR family transcriptional regulator